MGGVGLSAPGRVREPGLPGAAADGWLSDVRLVGGHPLSRGIFGPEPSRAAEVRDAAVCGNARAGENG